MKHDLTHALTELCPGAEWTLRGFDYEGLEWLDKKIPKPEEADLLAKIEELDLAEPMKLLRKERDKRLTDVDWVACRSVTTGTPVSKAWKDYMQVLRDLPEKSSPKLGPRGELDLSSVDWPVLPE